MGLKYHCTYYRKKRPRSGKVVNSVIEDENPSSTNSEYEFDTEKEDLGLLHSSSKHFKPGDRMATTQTSMPSLDRYYEGEQHQSGRHVTVIVSHILLMILVIIFFLQNQSFRCFLDE